MVLKYKSKKKFIRLIILSVIIFSSIGKVFAQQGVPKLYIQISGNHQIGDITKEEKLEAVMRIENANGSNFPAVNLFNGNIRIKGRGNSSWTDSKWENDYKRSFSIDLLDKSGKKSAVPLLGMPQSGDWILYASHFDKSFLRNYFSYELSRAMGYWAARSWFVELYVNDEYRGLYAVQENIKNEEQRAYVKEGYIIEQDYPQRLKDENAKYITSSIKYDGRWYYDDGPVTDSMYFGFKYPADDVRTPAQTKHIKDYITDFETALYGPDYSDPNIGYQKYIDTQSVADWYIIAELGADWDHSYFISSCYLSKPQNEKMKMCPVWDFDLAYNAVDYIVARNNVPWIRQMWDDPSFRQLVFKRFDEVLPLVENSISRIEEVAVELNNFGAIDRNFERWDYLGEVLRGRDTVPPKTFEGEVRRLSQRIRERYLYISTNSNNDYCNILAQTKPGITVINQNTYDDGQLPLLVMTTGSLRSGTTFIWNNETPAITNKYSITDYGEYQLKIRMGTCESLPSDPIYVKRLASVTVTDVLQQYDGAQKNVTVATDPPALPVRVTYNGSDALPVRIGTYRVVAEIDDELYKGKQVSTLTIAQDISTGMPEMPDVSPVVYPNPTGGILFIEVPEILTADHRATIELINAAGVVCVRKQTGEQKIALDVKDLPNGLYLLRITVGEQTFVQKVLKME